MELLKAVLQFNDCDGVQVWNGQEMVTASARAEVILAAGTTFDSTVSNLIVGLAVNAGASEALTFEQIMVEAANL